jgi:hypothetical protein
MENKKGSPFPLSHTSLKTALSLPLLKNSIVYLYKIKIFILGKPHFIKLFEFAKIRLFTTFEKI